jgi:protein subunit release factor B
LPKKAKRLQVSKELAFSVTLDDCRVDTFRSGGKGGQNQNKRDTGVRVVHEPSGAVGESREERSQLQNKKRAFEKMATSSAFKWWAALRLKEIETGLTLEQRVQEWMSPENLKVEGKSEGKWIEID